ncbi:TRAP transporter small permease [Marinivivus vitaminiproducens]|uniref:TRAP transporter small permease n=1 Tax=Marinivivus vitaminiproducens TaxID=3035935 RepID=UPI0027A4E0A0|nr:TRAP transporter small permease [Geminicoccaceae bacterium SCSIO 64248]
MSQSIDSPPRPAEGVHTQITAEEIAHTFEDEAHEVDLKAYAFEDWVTLVVFWGMAVCVFLQFFTRYVLNNSFAWTEEIAINGLIVTVFLGSVMCVRLSRHIQVDVLYYYLPRRTARFLAIGVDIARIAFFAYMSVLIWRYVRIVARERMVTVNLPRSIIFWSVFAGFVLMLLRSLQVAYGNYRRGYSALEQQATAEGKEA